MSPVYNETYVSKEEVRKMEKLEVKVYVSREIAELFKTIAHKKDMTRSELFGEILTDYLTAMAKAVIS